MIRDAATGRPVDFGAVPLGGGDGGGDGSTAGGLTYDQLHQVSYLTECRGLRSWIIESAGSLSSASGELWWLRSILLLVQMVESILSEKGYYGAAISEQELLEFLPPTSFGSTLPRPR